MVSLFGAFRGLILQYTQYNCSKSMVNLVFSINFGFWLLSLQN
jgi:hypothetical protein